MDITVEAIYEHGVLKPTRPLALPEFERVLVTVQPVSTFVAATFGLLGGKVDASTVEQVAMGPEFDVLERP